jgi:hypothetical protein
MSATKEVGLIEVRFSIGYEEPTVFGLVLLT